MIPYAAVSSVREDDFGRIVLSRAGGLAVDLSTALGSLEACTLLAEGLSTNLAVAPGAAELMEPRLAALRAQRASSLARWHKVDASGTTHTFGLHRGKQASIGVLGLLFGALFLAGAVIFPLTGGGLGPGYELLFIGMGFFFVWGGICAFRSGVRVRDGKLIIGNELSTRTIRAGDIRAITLEPKKVSGVATHWRARVELTDGRMIWIDDFDCGNASRPPDPDLAAAVEEVRVLLGIGADNICPPRSRQADSSAE